MNQLPILYKRAKTGATTQWQIIVENNTFYTVEGQVDGKLTTSKPTVCDAKNEERANATTSEEQAYKEALSKWNKKKEHGYNEDINNIDEELHFTEPMLAHKYVDYKDDLIYPVHGQRKFDGIRCIIRKDGAWTRNGKKHMCIPHIVKALQPIFDANPDTILDGELYNHEFHDNFNKITSLVRKTKPTLEDLKESEQLVQYYCYDAPKIGNLTQSDSFSQRNRLVQTLLCDIPYVKVVETVVLHSEEDIKKYHEQFVEDGYEGIMVRLNKGYEHKRSKNLLKYKTFETDEFEIIDIVEGVGNRSGMAGYAICQMKNGKTFRANIKGTHEWLKTLLTHRLNVIGKQGTVKYFNITPDGSLRFPVMIEIRDYE